MLVWDYCKRQMGYANNWLNSNVRATNKRLLLRFMVIYFILLLLLIFGEFAWLTTSKKTKMIKEAVGTEVCLILDNGKIIKGILDDVELRYDYPWKGFCKLAVGVAGQTKDGIPISGGCFLLPWELWRIEVVNRESIDDWPFDLHPPPLTLQEKRDANYQDPTR